MRVCDEDLDTAAEPPKLLLRRLKKGDTLSTARKVVQAGTTI